MAIFVSVRLLNKNGIKSQSDHLLVLSLNPHLVASVKSRKYCHILILSWYTTSTSASDNACLEEERVLYYNLSPLVPLSVKCSLQQAIKRTARSFGQFKGKCILYCTSMPDAYGCVVQYVLHCYIYKLQTFPEDITYEFPECIADAHIAPARGWKRLLQCSAVMHCNE
jgi:hypothetical protein